ncbi:MAG TPA: LacI family DNA-binding transcriptional regulator [Candidatus Cryosericum sp.]|nr:LacI family DNA-binding transcriptional regulator [Candidatus Cryosericum sp.]
MVTLKDISKECGVSQATVSKALNGLPDIGEETANYIRSVADRMGYLPNATARALKLGISHNIGILFVDKTSCGLKHEYFSEILNSLKVEAERLGYDITFISKDIGKFSMDYYKHAKYRNCDGVVIASVDFKDPDVIRLVESEIPTVTLDYTFDSRSSVLSDNVGGMQEIVRHVFSNGHRRIAFIHGEDTSVTQKRIASFFKACSEFDLRVPEAYVRAAIYHDPRSSGLATRDLLALPERPTCILYPDDFSFIGGMNELERQGLSIPDDMSVVGYDGILLSQVLRPKLTTFRQDAETMGRKAAALLVEQIENPKSWLPQLVTVSGTLLEGHSVKPIQI